LGDSTHQPLEKKSKFSLTSLVLCAALTPAADPDHPVVAIVRAAIQDPSKPFVLFVQIKVKDGTGRKFKEAFAKVAKESRKEKGNRAYDLSRSTKNPNEYLVYERWDNLAVLAAHLKTPRFQEAAAAIGDLGYGSPVIGVFIPVGD
jgi:quinol monooxygenase YgiN